ncbi:PIR Superfamily Protein [Plasmodium ovale wallikeri]|uniref:PIR Superfamily Protein n=1 Tax=Plasmodium ovale wallikeri TaxID=864142 RepID=A0A1A9ALU4_PLAOA|nr:PIR Superfamily Protein [Plasmodium ovale wallikeri]SBT57740.1 PIR Superfamily Protein [Plasmodium ovale wallikeri]
MPSQKETIYNVVKSLDTYKNKLSSESQYEDSIGIADCQEFHSSYLDDAVSERDKICNRVIIYLSHLKEGNLNFRDQGCRYLSYWLYFEVLKEKKSVDNTINLYKEFLKKYEDYDDPYKFEAYLKEFNGDMLQKLIKLIELNEKFKEFQGKSYSTCESEDIAQECVNKYISYVNECYTDNDNDFCDELENFKQIYDSHMKNIRCSNDVPKTLPPIDKFNVASIATISFVIALVITFVLFIFYKFTPFGLRITSQLKRKKKMYDDLDQETKQLPYTYDKSNINSEKHKHSLSYQTV